VPGGHTRPGMPVSILLGAHFVVRSLSGRFTARGVLFSAAGLLVPFPAHVPIGIACPPEGLSLALGDCPQMAQMKRGNGRNGERETGKRFCHGCTRMHTDKMRAEWGEGEEWERSDGSGGSDRSGWTGWTGWTGWKAEAGWRGARVGGVRFRGRAPGCAMLPGSSRSDDGRARVRLLSSLALRSFWLLLPAGCQAFELGPAGLGRPSIRTRRVNLPHRSRVRVS
jgi:hypothetical protein